LTTYNEQHFRRSEAISAPRPLRPNPPDHYGHKWFVATHVEDVPPDEMQRRAAAAMEEIGH
jgi:hypothetical protein